MMLVIPDHFLVCKVGGNARLRLSLVWVILIYFIATSGSSAKFQPVKVYNNRWSTAFYMFNLKVAVREFFRHSIKTCPWMVGVSLIVLTAPLVSVTRQTHSFEMVLHEPACHSVPYASHELHPVFLSPVGRLSAVLSSGPLHSHELEVLLNFQCHTWDQWVN